jgi:iron complex transport system substrate-binding protein
MRIASLLPSATEIVCALGLRDELVAVSHCCDYPPEIEGLPIVTRPLQRRSLAVDFAAGELGAADLEVQALLALEPDLVIAAEGSPGSLGATAVRTALERRGSKASIVSLDPVSIEGIFHSITSVGAMAEAEDEAIELLEALREDLGDIEQHAVVRRDEGVRAPRVAILQSVEPPFASGRWVPDQARRAGGWDVLGRDGEPPAEIGWQAVRDVDPEMLLFAPAGVHLPAARRAFARLDKPEFWPELEAVRRGRVFVLEPAYFERPGPRVVDGVALLAELLDPEGFVETAPSGSWELVTD